MSEKENIKSTNTYLPRSRFSVETVPHADRYSLWKESISSIYDIDVAQEYRDDGFHASIESVLVGSLMLTGCHSVKQDFVRSEQTIARDGMDHYFLQFYLDGELAWADAGPEQILKTGNGYLFDLTRPTESTATQFQNLGIFIPRPLLEKFIAPTSSLHGVTLQGNHPLTRILRDHLVNIFRMSTTLEQSQSAELEESLIQLSVAAIKAAHPGGDGMPDDRLVAPTMLLAKQAILKNLADPDLSAAKIAKMANVSRAKLYTLFHPIGGVAEYIRELRLKKAMQILTRSLSPRLAILDIALTCGYQSEAAFARAFKNRFGISPREARLVSPPKLPNTVHHNHAPDRQYETWLHQLIA